MDTDFTTRVTSIIQLTLQQLMYVLSSGSVDPSLMGKILAVTNILENSKVTVALAFGSDHAPASVVLLLLIEVMQERS